MPGKKQTLAGSSAGTGRQLAPTYDGPDKSDRWYNFIDPLYQLVRLICLPITRSGQLSQPQREFIAQNVDKHRRILWINVVLVLIFYFLRESLPSDRADLSIIIQVLIAPAFITGGAWFAITFGAIPRFLLDQAIQVTFWMFLAFSTSLNLMGLLLTRIAHPMICVVFYLIVCSCLIASILYDNIDGLKIGLDQVLLRSGQAMIRLFEALTRENTQDLVDREELDPAEALVANLQIVIDSDVEPKRIISIVIKSGGSAVSNLSGDSPATGRDE